MASFDSSDWVAVFSSGFIPKVELFKSLLEEAGIPAIIHNQKDTSYGFGEAQLFVKSEFAVKAKHIIKE